MSDAGECGQTVAKGALNRGGDSSREISECRVCDETSHGGLMRIKCGSKINH